MSAPTSRARAARLWRVGMRLLVGMGAGMTSACSVVAPNAVTESVKVAGAVAVVAIATGPSVARDTVIHPHAPLKAVCIEYNPQTPDAEMPAALMRAFRMQGVDSRLFDGADMPDACTFRLRYTGEIAWERSPLEGGYSKFLRAATLTLYDTSAGVAATSAYRLDATFEVGKWATTQSKLTPMVQRLASEVGS